MRSWFAVILTRFSRVTFNAAHRYLGLTSEVLRTEKAINEIACHPLPPSFYEGGGLQYLRHRFDGASSSTSDSESDYFSFSQSSSLYTASPIPKSRESSTSSLGKIDEDQPTSKNSFSKDTGKSKKKNKSSRQMVQAGDLLVPKGSASDVFRPLSRSFSVLNTPRVSLSSGSLDDSDAQSKTSNQRTSSRWSADDFDLREEVMSCIAKSIGLLQPPLSGSDSVERSPLSPPADQTRKPNSTFASPFGSLSLLDIGDDVSTTSASVMSSTNNLSGLDNEVEILFYPAGSTLAKAGELNTGMITNVLLIQSANALPGLFYVIEGFLDILLPVDEPSKVHPSPPKTPRPESGPWATPHPAKQPQEQKLLFTVKPGGIAGYLGKSTIFVHFFGSRNFSISMQHGVLC